MIQKNPTAQDVHDHIRHGREVLDLEIAGLRALHDSLGQEFIDAVEAIAGICHAEGSPGRLIISGMGKSGHIGRKIAATMASTGTPAHYVHPGEASHGDLGMITARDAVLVLSNSGETKELGDIVAHAKRLQRPLIAIVGRDESTLGQAADIALILPAIVEASPTGAPTTSTIMSLAMGDALAMALLERRGFTQDDFARFHPGGKLGQAFLKVEELMHGESELPLVQENTGMHDVLLEMTAKHFGCAGVLDNSGALTGVITDGDLRRHMEDNLLSLSAAEIMTRNPVTISPQALAAEAIGLLNAKNITSLFVTQQDRPVGIIHIHDCLRAGLT